MIFNGKFVNLELKQVASTATSGTIQINITRNNPYYFNTEGLYVEVTDMEVLLPEKKWIWFTEFNPHSSTRKTHTLNVSKERVENKFSEELTYSISKLVNETISRQGAKNIKVRLIENTPSEPEVIAEGIFTLTTLEIPLPVIYELKITVTVDEIKQKVVGVNPQNLYTLQLLASNEGNILLDENNEHTTTIIDAWRKDKVEYIARYLLGDKVITEVRQTITVPSGELGMWIKIDGSWTKVDALYRKISDDWKTVVDVQLKSGDLWYAQE